MATRPISFWARLVDGLQVQAGVSSHLQLPDTATIADLESALTTWADAVNGCVGGAVVQVGVSLFPPLPGGLNTAAGATWAASRMGQTVVLDFANAVDDGHSLQVFASGRDSLIAGGKITLSAPAIVTMASVLTSSVLGGSYTDSADRGLVSLLGGHLSFRKHHDQMAGLASIT